MAGKIYINQPVEVEIDITVDGVKMTTGVTAEIRARSPRGQELTWTATVDNVGGKVTYSAIAGEINASGVWSLQPIVTLAGVPSVTLPGETVSLTVYDRFQ